MMLWFAALKVLILAGGIDAQQNHDSHKAHVDRMLSLLSQSQTGDPTSPETALTTGP